MKKRKQIVISSLLMLVVAAMALTSTTYAWFTKSDSATFDGADFEAAQAEGIQMSADGASWVSTIYPDAITDLVDAEDASQTGSAYTKQMNPVSSALEIADGALKIFRADASTDGNSLSTVAQDAEGYYSQFNLYFLNDGEESITLKLNLMDSKVQNKEENTAKQKHIENAVRVAFVNQGTTDYSAENYLTTVVGLNGATEAKVWEPNATAHDTKATSTRYAVGADGKPLTTKVVNGTTYNYLGVNSAASDLELDKGYITATAVELVDDTIKTGNEIEIGTIEAGKVLKVTVYIWIEGQDVDCSNAQSGGKLTATLKFTK